MSAVLQRAGSAKHLVAIDGFMGSGKTALALALADSLGGIRVSLDSYIDRDVESDEYVSKIMQHYLSSDLRKLAAMFQFVIVEGICVLDALTAASLKPGSHVYVKRFSKAGLWHDGLHLEDYETDKAFAEQQPTLRKSELKYHSEWRPHQKATDIYERLEP